MRLSIVLALAAIVLSSSPMPAQSVYVDLSNSGARDIGLGGALRVARIGIGDLDVYAGARNFFVNQGNVTDIGVQAGVDLLLRPEIIKWRRRCRSPRHRRRL